MQGTTAYMVEIMAIAGAGVASALVFGLRAKVKYAVGALKEQLDQTQQALSVAHAKVEEARAALASAPERNGEDPLDVFRSLKMAMVELETRISQLGARYEAYDDRLKAVNLKMASWEKNFQKTQKAMEEATAQLIQGTAVASPAVDGQQDMLTGDGAQHPTRRRPFGKLPRAPKEV